jgi:hypothetical protein
MAKPLGIFWDSGLQPQDADIHFSGMQIDSAIIFVLLVVKIHVLPPFAWVDCLYGDT